MKEDIKKILFIKAMSALEAYQAAVAAHWPSQAAKDRQTQFAALWDLIEEAHLDEEFELWKAG